MPASPHTLARHCAPRTVIHLDAHRPVVMHVEPMRPHHYTDDGSAMRWDAAPTVENINAGAALLEQQARNGGGAHAVSEVGQPEPSPAPRIPRLTAQRVGEGIGNVIGWGVVGLLAFMFGAWLIARFDLLRGLLGVWR